MKYDFNKLSERRNTSSIKWDVKENELPMWVADMDFVQMPEIQEAVINAAKDGSYGYTYPTDDFFKAYQYWWKLRHDIDIDYKNMVFATGVVSALDSLVRTLTNENENVMILSPVYNNFFTVVTSNKRNLIISDLIYQNDDFFIDYEDVEEKVKKNNVKLFIFCNPHNPIGKIWKKEEIEKLYNILSKYNVQMISDEIHCDIVEPGCKYVPALAVGQDIITCMAPSKVFNLAGLHSAVTVINNPTLKENLPNIKLVSGQATYLLWLDISKYGIPSDVFVKELREETGLYINDGLHYGPNGGNFIRINIATSLNNVKDGMNRLSNFLKGK